MTDIFFDVMDTLVIDPYLTALPEFFGTDFQTLIKNKDQTLWPRFERGEIDEATFLDGYFPDGPTVDGDALRAHLRAAYEFIPGVETLLSDLNAAGHRLHTFTNYPVWHMVIEDKLRLSRYLKWTVVSCQLGVRKPDPEIYARALDRVETDRPWFIDDRQVNVDAAVKAGFFGELFRDAGSLRRRFVEAGLL